MPNKAKLDIFVMLRFLCMVFMLPHSLYAETNAGQEIGETYYDSGQFRGMGIVDSATLAPTGDRLYTLKDSVLRQYNLRPLKRINAMKVAFDSRQAGVDSYKTFITNDEKRIVIYSKTQLRLLDIKTGKIIKTVPFKSELGVLNNDEIFTLDNDNKATVWNVDDLTKKKEFVALEPWSDPWSNNKNSNTGGCRVGCRLIKAANHVILHRMTDVGKVFVFDGASYRQVWNLAYVDYPGPTLSYDLNTLYIGNSYRKLWYSGKQIDHIEEFRQKNKGVRIGEILKVDIATAQVDYVFKKDFKSHRYILLMPLGGEQQISPTHQYHLFRHKCDSHYLFFYREEDKARQKKVFLQFEDGEAVFISKAGSFQATEHARKHLKMKNSKGELVPINDATFEKFNKANVDHKKW